MLSQRESFVTVTFSTPRFRWFWIFPSSLSRNMRFLENVYVVCLYVYICVCVYVCYKFVCSITRDLKRYQVYLWQLHEVHFEVVQVQFYIWLDNFKYLINEKEKYGKIENNFFFVAGFGYLSEVVTFYERLKLPINPYFCRPNRKILSRLKKNKE